MRLWQKKTETDDRILKYTVGDDPAWDSRLVPCDCRASRAHAETLCKAGILTRDETDRLNETLDEIAALAGAGKFEIPQEMEDCHTAIESFLTERLGDLGKKIHTGRSRNDQVLAALRLYYIGALDGIRERAGTVIRTLNTLSEKSGSIRLPGYTHTRKAMPSTVAMWAGAFAESMEDNLKLTDAVRGWIDQSPLGTGAGYGVPLDLDRAFTAEKAGFSRVQQSPVYVQLSRGKFEWALLHALGQIMLDLNRLAGDLILFSMPAFGYFRLPGEFCTGSSIMPQKKNPDVLELLRAKYHIVLGYQTLLGSLASNLISGYHRDLQLTKKPVMESLDLTAESLEIIRLVLDKLEIDEEACLKDLTEELFATEKVYELVRQGMPFREAYRRVGEQYE
ncbi:MAG TPA: argininosuccinate lyase [bacterium]|nr:argininosuccinate lyase [bacterium]